MSHPVPSSPALPRQAPSPAADALPSDREGGDHVDVPLGPEPRADIDLDESDQKLSQAEMKDEAVKYLLDAIQQQVTEEHARTIFDRQALARCQLILRAVTCVSLNV